MRSRFARWSVAAALSAACVWLAVAGAAGPAACANATVHDGATGTWTVYAAPDFGEAKQEIVAHAVDPSAPNHWYVTNGTQIQASSDGGCHWHKSYELPSSPSADMPLDASNGEIHALSAGNGTALATVVGNKTSATNPVPLPSPIPQQLNQEITVSSVTIVLRSGDAGTSFQATQTLPNVNGGAGPILQVPNHPDTVYLGTGLAVRRSTDGGKTFGSPSFLIKRDDPDTNHAEAADSVKAFAADPGDPDHVLVRGPFAVWHASDGQTFERYASPVEGRTLLGPVLGRSQGQANARGFLTQGDEQFGTQRVSTYLVSEDGGANWGGRHTEEFGRIFGVPISMTVGADREDVTITTDATVARWNPKAKKFVGVDEFDLGPLYDARATGGDPSTVSFFQPHKLVRWEAPPGGIGSLPTPKPRPTPNSDDNTPAFNAPFTDPPIPADDLAGKEGHLEPDKADVHVPVGGTVDKDYTLTMPARPGRLDTFFLLDTSASTSPYILALEEGLHGLTRALTDANIDGWFGVGEYQDVTGSNVRYRRRAAIRPPDDYVTEQLDSIETGGGDREPGYTAIDQAVTGSGIPHPKDGSAEVPAGQDAKWRRASTRLVFHVADEPFGNDPHGATRDQAVKHLIDHHVQFMGIAVNTGDRLAATDVCPLADRPPTPPAVPNQNKDSNTLKLRCQLEDIARATKTFAPAGGVDCNGDGIIDIAPGGPLVCVIPEQNGTRVAGLADAVRRLLLSVKFPQPISLAAADGTKVKVDVTPGGDYSALDLRADHALNFKAAFSCPDTIQGKDFDVDVQGLVETLPFVHAHPHVFCDAPAAAVVPPPHKKAAPLPPHKPAVAKAVAPAVQPQPVIALVPIQPPPPARVPVQQAAQAQAQAPQPGQATSQVVQSQGQTSPVQMAAEQKQESPVIQKVHIDNDPAPGDDSLNFSRNDDVYGVDHDAWWAAMLVRMLGTAGVLGAGAAAVRRRSKTTQTRKARNDR